MKIMVVDDDAMIAQVIVNVLGSMLRQKADVYTDGDEAIQCFIDAQVRNEPYDLVFLDLNMSPGKNGIEVLWHMRQYADDIVTVCCTGNPLIDYQEYGFTHMLEKPFAINDLVSIVEITRAVQ